MQDRADDDVENYRCERQRSADSAAWAFAAGADFLGYKAADRGKKDSGEENGEDPEVKGGEPVESETAGGEGPEELDAGSLTNVEGEMKKGCGKSGGEDSSARDLVFGGFGLEGEEGKSEEEAEHERGEE